MTSEKTLSLEDSRTVGAVQVTVAHQSVERDYASWCVLNVVSQVSASTCEDCCCSWKANYSVCRGTCYSLSLDCESQLD